MKNKKVWVKWFANRHGLIGDWAETWVQELKDEGLPGKDFVLLAPNTSYDERIQHPAEYQDLRRGLHFLLHVSLDLSVEDSVMYNPHCFRHFLIESGQQLRAMKVCSTDDMERLGRWAKGSSMPDTYDNALGLSELMARHTVLQELRRGWRPAAEGELPAPRSAASSTRSTSSTSPVAHAGTKMVHIKMREVGKTKCGMWSCGDRSNPHLQAKFDNIPSSWLRCRTCGAIDG